MPQYTVDITEEMDPGITAAREARNNNLPFVVGPPEEQPVPLETNAEYVQFVMTGAAESYCRQYAIPIALVTRAAQGPEVESTEKKWAREHPKGKK